MPNLMEIPVVGVARLNADRRTVMKLVSAFRGYAKSAQKDRTSRLQSIAGQVGGLRYRTVHSRMGAFRYSDFGLSTGWRIVG